MTHKTPSFINTSTAIYITNMHHQRHHLETLSRIANKAPTHKHQHTSPTFPSTNTRHQQSLALRDSSLPAGPFEAPSASRWSLASGLHFLYTAFLLHDKTVPGLLSALCVLCFFPSSVARAPPPSTPFAIPFCVARCLRQRAALPHGSA